MERLHVAILPGAPGLDVQRPDAHAGQPLPHPPRRDPVSLPRARTRSHRLRSALRRLLPVVPLLLASCSSTPGQGRDRASLTGEQVVPLTTVEFSGHRYVAHADLGPEKHVPLMVHGNARFFLSLTHAVAEKLHGGPLKKMEEYGYSSKGKGLIDIPTMSLGGRRFRDLSQVPVFDFTEEGDTLVQGMLGVRFLTAARGAVDFSRDALILGVAISAQPNPGLLDRGYKYARMSISARSRVTIEAFFPSIGRVIPITPSTVSTALTLHQPLFAGKVPMKQTASPDRSPSGTSADEYLADAVSFEVAGVRLQSAASFEDLAEYANVPEGELESFGMLGFDWMAQHKAILDYANRFLYFRP
jgi:hypothetical protein